MPDHLRCAHERNDEVLERIYIGRRFKNDTERLAYAQSAIEHGWSRNVLNIDIETRRLERSGKAVTNFAERLPAAGTDLARQGSSHWRGGIPVDRIAAR